MDDWRLGCRDKGLKFGVWVFGRVGEWEGEVVGKPGDSVALLGSDGDGYRASVLGYWPAR